MRKVDAKVERAKTPLNQFLSNDVAELQLSGGSWPLSRLLRKEFTVGDHVVIIHKDDFMSSVAAIESLQKQIDEEVDASVRESRRPTEESRRPESKRPRRSGGGRKSAAKPKSA